MFARAIAWGHRPEAAGNPFNGITHYRRPPHGRLLSEDDLARLGAVLRRLETRLPLKVAAARLIVLMGWRSGEVRRLRWRDMKRDRLVLHESKTGPRLMPLGEAARKVLDHLSNTRSGEWVFPGSVAGHPLSETALRSFWRSLRDDAGIEADAWLHDSRHSHASHAITNGESLHMAGLLPGHRRASTTNRYAHLDNAILREAAERVALAVERKLCCNEKGVTCVSQLNSIAWTTQATRLRLVSRPNWLDSSATCLSRMGPMGQNKIPIVFGDRLASKPVY